MILTYVKSVIHIMFVSFVKAIEKHLLIVPAQKVLLIMARLLALNVISNVLLVFQNSNVKLVQLIG